MSIRDVSDIFLLASIFVVVLPSINGECYKGWIHFKDSCYMFSDTTENWILAEASCMSHEARLAEVYSKNQSDFLNEKVKSLGHHYWLGARDDVIEGEWQWASSGEYFNFTDWAPGAPNNHDERCTTIDDEHNYEWNDESCHETHRYICERGQISCYCETHRYICERVTSTGECTRGWLLFEDMCYLIGDTYETWLLAQGSCKAHGGRLAEDNNNRLNNFLVGSLRNQSLTHEYWIGGKEEPTTFVWQWVSTGQPFTFTNWAHHRPDPPDTKDCLMIHDQWADASCHENHYYICEKRYLGVIVEN